MTTTQDTADRFWRRRAEASLRNARRSLIDAGLAFADDGDVTTQTYYFRYEDAGATTPRRRTHE
jgi:hypothetical protein